MEEAKALSLGEVVVTTTVERSSDVAMNIELKKAAIIGSGITASEIRKTPDRTVGDILKRVTGASIQDGRFAIIRGMNDRYNAGYLDGALMSSTESDRKAFSFDVVPANLIDNLMIIKTGTADMIGDFGGGIIKINTKSVPDKLVQNITVGAQCHSLTTFNEFRQFKTYPSEEFNILSDQRNIPDFTDGALKLNSTFPTMADKLRLGELSKKFNNDWSNESFTANPNTRLAYSIGFPVQLNGNHKLGVIMALNYSNTRKISANEINTYDGSGQVSGFTDKSYLRNITTGGIFNVNYIGEHTRINFQNLLNINTDNTTILRTGTANFSDVLTVQNTANQINYNRLYSGIASLKQLIGDSILNINASFSYSNVHREIPDYRIASYFKLPDFTTYQLTLGDFFNSSTGRFASELDENIYSGTFELSKKIDAKQLKTELKVGGFYQNRDRNFAGRSFVYSGSPDELTLKPEIDLGAKNIDATKLFLVEKTSDDLAYYTGKSTLTALYASADQSYKSSLRAVYGLRFENIDLDVNNQRVNAGVAHIKQMSILPSLNLTYSLGEKTNLRASYFSSVNRPEFRELAPFAFYVFDKNAEVRGNRDLQIANLKNFDVRYEFYPQGGQLISIGGFYKSLNHPIELTLDVTQAQTTFTFHNEKSAVIYGLEIEFKKKLDFMGTSAIFKDLAIYSNFSLIHSELQFNEGSLSKTDRPLQGQSPYIINARLQYENPNSGWSLNLGYNKVGRRIAFVGVDPKYGNTRQDIYEDPRSVIDLQIGKTFNNLNIKLTLGDLLHNDLVYYQDVDNNGSYTNSGEANSDRLMYIFNNGFTTTLSLGYTF
jgi:outer membrane receptor for ferrienterochelin and colicin